MTKTANERGSYQCMRQRCHNPRAKGYENYGGRGISVCDRWLNSFEAFLADMGPKPGPEYSIDRIDNNGNYEPGNCRWATRKEQAQNKRPLMTCAKQRVVIQIRTDQEQKAQWVAAAKANDLSLSEWFKLLADSHSGKNDTFVAKHRPKPVMIEEPRGKCIDCRKDVPFSHLRCKGCYVALVDAEQGKQRCGDNLRHSDEPETRPNPALSALSRLGTLR